MSLRALRTFAGQTAVRVLGGFGLQLWRTVRKLLLRYDILCPFNECPETAWRPLSA